VLLCREAIVGHFGSKNRENAPGYAIEPKPRLSNGLPPAGAEAALYSRLAQVERLEAWIQGRLRAELSAHLEGTHPAFQGGLRLGQALGEWEFCVRQVLPDTLAEFARELRGLRQLAADPHRRGGLATAPEFVLLRRIAARVEEQQLQIARIAADIAEQAQEIGVGGVLPPLLPDFRRLIWVDWLAVVPAGQLVSEVTRIEGELRHFLNHEHADLLARFERSRGACGTLQERILTEYWNRLRAYAQSHYVEEKEVDAVLGSLSARYEPEIARREEARLLPFATT